MVVWLVASTAYSAMTNLNDEMVADRAFRRSGRIPRRAWCVGRTCYFYNDVQPAFPDGLVGADAVGRYFRSDAFSRAWVTRHAESVACVID
jgi:hypothetical protein